MNQTIYAFHAEATDDDETDFLLTASHQNREQALRSLATQIADKVYKETLNPDMPAHKVLRKWTEEDSSRHWVVYPITIFGFPDPDAIALARRTFDLMSTELQDMAYDPADWDLAVAEKELYTLACKVLGQEPDLNQFLADVDWTTDEDNDLIGSQELDSDSNDVDTEKF